MTSKSYTKRSRQLNLYECFQNCKSPKRRNLMDDQTKADMRERLAAAAEKRMKDHDPKSAEAIEIKGTKKILNTLPNTNDTSIVDRNKVLLNSSTNSNKSPPKASINTNETSKLSTNVNKISPKASANTTTVPKLSGNVSSNKSLNAEETIGNKSSYINETSSNLPTSVKKANTSLKEHFVVKDTKSTSQSKESNNVSSQSANSDDLFSDSFPEDFNFSQNSDKENSLSSEEVLPKISDLNRLPSCEFPLPQLAASSNHTILFRPHLRDGCAPRPYPDTYRDKWDSDHVRMPCSPMNEYPVTFSDGQKIIQSRWELICESLRQRIESSSDLERAILQYNSQYEGKWSFLGLHSFFNKFLKSTQKTFFFNKILPNMVKLALQLPEIVTHPIPLLKKHMDHSITLSQKQIGCLLANAFFCTFPRRNACGKWQKYAKQKSEYSSYPCINFNRLFYGTKTGITHKNAEKLKCLINYFLRITESEPSGTVTFHRKYIEVFPNWEDCDTSLKKAVIIANGLIETEGNGMLQVDFANSYVGGGVIGQGCVQEEIRFTICPELIVSMLFTEQLTESEALIATGIEQYNNYSGYGDSFEWNGNYYDSTQRDAWGRKYTQVLAIDALPFRNSSAQYRLNLIKRELNKAYVGFFDQNIPHRHLPAIATGNWGCGVYNGNPDLKFLIQLMAASEAGRDIVYFTFGDKKLQESLQKMYKFVKEKQLNVGSLWSIFNDYFNEVMGFHEDYRPKLFDYIYGVQRSKIQIEENTAAAESSSDSQITIAETPDFDIQGYNSSDTEEEN